MLHVCMPSMPLQQGRNPTHLGVITKLVVKPLPGSFVWIRNGDVVSIWQRPELLSRKRNATLKEGQHCITKIKPFLQCNIC